MSRELLKFHHFGHSRSLYTCSQSHFIYPYTMYACMCTTCNMLIIHICILHIHTYIHIYVYIYMKNISRLRCIYIHILCKTTHTHTHTYTHIYMSCFVGLIIERNTKIPLTLRMELKTKKQIKEFELIQHSCNSFFIFLLQIPSIL